MSNVALVDVKHLDGEPWDVARVAGDQTTAAIQLSLEALDGMFWAARGSWLSQEHHRTGTMPDREAFEASPLAEHLLQAQQSLAVTAKQIKTTTAAASFDPRSWT